MRTPIDRIQTRSWQVYQGIWTVTMHSQGWVEPEIWGARPEDSSPGDSDIVDTVIGLTVSDHAGHVGDYAYQIALANSIVDEDEARTGPSILSLALLNACHDLWEGTGEISTWSQEIIDGKKEEIF